MGNRGFIKEETNYNLGEVKRPEGRARITRKLLNLNQSEVCKATGISRHLLSQVENGETRFLHYDQALKLFCFYRDYFRDHGTNSKGRFNALNNIRDGKLYASFDFFSMQDLFTATGEIVQTSGHFESIPYHLVWIKDSVHGRIVLVSEKDFPIFKEKVLAFKGWEQYRDFKILGDEPSSHLKYYDCLLWDPSSPSEGEWHTCKNDPSKEQISFGQEFGGEINNMEGGKK